MRKLLLLISLGYATILSAQEENAVNVEDPGPQMPEHLERFDILQLPKGASVVLPHPAATIVPLNIKVQASATDKKQILKISAVSETGSVHAVRIAIYDRHLARVKYLDVRPGSPIIYAFKNLNTIEIVPQNGKDSALRQTKLLFESNRPLGLGY